jgi:aspartyl-tRNA(Asn)/glutamyl-tRNA(Gln) amidotransferase subunit A
LDLSISALDYQRGIKNGDFTVEEFISKSLERIESVDKNLHAFLKLNDLALENAKEIDRKIKSNQNVGKCFGMPISVKDNICIAGSITTCGSKALEHFKAPYTATVIDKLNSEDAIIIGKTNLDEFAMGLSTEFSAYGKSKNPWNMDYVPGGSSGGSAVSVSANECIASLGSDTGGSIRNPASFCSVVGLKPTYGLVSRYGLVSYANSIEQIGPLTKTVEDSAFLLNIISGIDPNDNTTIDNDNEDYLSNIDAGIEGKKIGIISEMTNSEGINDEVLNSTNDAIKTFEKLGASCEYVSLQMVRYAVAAYYTITSTEAGSNLARYDNIRYGYEFDTEGFEFNSYISQARNMLGPEVKRRMILGGFVPSAGHAGKYFLKALKVKSKLIKEINLILTGLDFLISPTVPIQPFKFGEKIDDPVSFMLVDFNTVTANLTGKPAISVPYKIVNGLPVGIQIMADSMNEIPLLQAAYALEKTVELPEVPI